MASPPSSEARIEKETYEVVCLVWYGWVFSFSIGSLLPFFIGTSAEDLLLHVMLKSVQHVEVSLGTEQQQRGSESMG